MVNLGHRIEDREPRPLTRLMWVYAQSITSDLFLYELYNMQAYEYIDTYLLYKMFEESIGRYKEQKFNIDATGVIDTWSNKLEKDDRNA